MPNNPLPTPTPPSTTTSPTRLQPASGVVNQGSAPRMQTPMQPGSPKGAQTPVPAAVVKPAMPTGPSTTVAPGQIRPPSIPAPTTPAKTQPNQIPVAQTVQKPAASSQPAAVASKPAPQPTSPQAQQQPNKPVAQNQPGLPNKPVVASTPGAPVPVSKPVTPTAPAPGMAKPTLAPSATAIPTAKPVTPGVTVSTTTTTTTTTPVLAAKPGLPNLAPSTLGAAPGLPKPGQLPVTPAPVSPTVTPAPAAATTSAGANQATPVKKPPALLFAVIGVVLLGILGFVGYTLFAPKDSTQPTSSAGTTDTTKTATTSAAADKSGTKTSKTTTGKQTTISYWGLWEPTEILAEVIADFESANPQYKIDYRKQSHRDYRERLQTAIASGNGPDIFRFHASWTPMLQDELAPLPSTVMSESEYKKTFYPIAAKQLQANGKLVGVPLMYDGLALYYNVDILKTADAEPPQTWAELRTLADSLTVPSDKSLRSSAPIQRAGLAIGNADNVEHFADILGLLILQNGGDFTKPNSPEVRDALLFYTNFIKEDIVWSSALPSSTVAFARGDVAMMLAPSWRAHDIKNLNPNLKFGVAPAPKLGDTRLGWASYWAEGVNAKSKNQDGAWTFIKYLSTTEVLKKLYADASTVRGFGEIYPRQDMAAELNDDPITSQFLVDAPTAESWYLNSFTHDNGLNDQLIKYYTDAVNGVLFGKTIDESLQTVEAGTTQVLRQYNAK